MAVPRGGRMPGALLLKRRGGREGRRRARRAGRGVADGGGAGGRQQPGLPELDEVFQAGHEAGQSGQNQGVQCSDHPGLCGAMAGFGTDGGGDRASLCGQRG